MVAYTTDIAIQWIPSDVRIIGKKGAEDLQKNRHLNPLNNIKPHMCVPNVITAKTILEAMLTKKIKNE